MGVVFKKASWQRSLFFFFFFAKEILLGTSAWKTESRRGPKHLPVSFPAQG